MPTNTAAPRADFRARNIDPDTKTRLNPWISVDLRKIELKERV